MPISSKSFEFDLVGQQRGGGECKNFVFKSFYGYFEDPCYWVGLHFFNEVKHKNGVHGDLLVTLSRSKELTVRKNVFHSFSSRCKQNSLHSLFLNLTRIIEFLPRFLVLYKFVFYY